MELQHQSSWLRLPLSIHHSLQHTITLLLLPFRKPPLALPSCPATHLPLCPFLAKFLELDVYINPLQFFPLILSWTHFRQIFTPALCENCSFFNITNGIHISKPEVISQSSPSLTNQHHLTADDSVPWNTFYSLPGNHPSLCSL